MGIEKVYICAPFRGDLMENIKNAREYCRLAKERNYLPIATHFYFIHFMRYKEEAEMEKAMLFGQELLALCDAVWVFSMENPTSGMEKEIALAKELGIPVYNAVNMLGLKKDQ